MIRNACVFIWTFTFIIFTTNLAHADKLNEPNLWKNRMYREVSDWHAR